jgi:NADH-quinone oxidoreductase subunit J
MFFINVLIFLLTFLAILIFIFKNPIHSVLTLVLMFILSSIFLLNLNVEFLGFSILLIYAGAVAILFLFIVMLLNIKIKKNKNFQYNFNNLIILYSCLFIFNPFFITNIPLFNFPLNLNSLKLITVDYMLTAEILTNTGFFFTILYKNYFLHLLSVGFILLITIVGVLHLLLPFEKNLKLNYNNAQVNSTTQLLRKSLNSFIKVK